MSPLGLVIAGFTVFVAFFDDIVNAFLLFKSSVKTYILNTLIKIDEFIQMYFVKPFEYAIKAVNGLLDQGLDFDLAGLFEDMESDQEEITKKASEEMAKNHLDGMVEAYSNMDTGRLKKAVSNVLSSAFGGVTGGGGASAGGDAAGGDAAGGEESDLPFDPDGVEFITGIEDELAADMKAMEDFISQAEKMQQVGQLVGSEISGAFEQMGASLIDSLGLADTGLQGFVKGLAGTVMKLISMYLSQSIASAIAGATASGTGTGPAAIFTTPAFIATAVGGVMAAFAAIPKFANGGIVSAPTLAMVGDNRGAGNGNPEVIAPLNKLEGMMGGQSINVGGNFRIQGQDLVVALERANKERNRIL